MAFLNPSENGLGGLGTGICSDFVLLCLGSLQPWSHLCIRSSRPEGFPREMLVCGRGAELGSPGPSRSEAVKAFTQQESLLARRSGALVLCVAAWERQGLGQPQHWAPPSPPEEPSVPAEQRGSPGRHRCGEWQQAPRHCLQLLSTAFPTPQLPFARPGSNLAG